jgi:hypothetical protein
VLKGGDNHGGNGGCTNNLCTYPGLLAPSGWTDYGSGTGAVLVFQRACQLGCEGIVSKRLGSTYSSGRSKYWVKVKNPKAPAVKREGDEDCS